jgi:hypothetical protein
MNIFEILKHLFTNPKSDWIHDLDDKDISPVLIQRWLALDKMSAPKAAVLNKFAFTLFPKMYLSAAWSALFFNGQKLSKAPFIQYIKKKEIDDKYAPLLKKIQREYEMSDKDLLISRPFLIKAIEKDRLKWFAYYGMDDAFMKQFGMSIELFRQYGDRPVIPKKKTGLDAFFKTV